MRVVSARKSKGVLLRSVEGMPIQIPPAILKCQAILGPLPTLVWINLVALAQLGVPLQIDTLAQQMGVEKREISQALALLADRGWINDEGLEIQLVLPAVPESAPTSESVLDKEQAAYEWLIDYWSTRVAVPSPDEMRKLFYWMEKKELSHEVIAVAIEEMCVAVARPSFAYLEGILRNWHGVGIRTYNDLLENPHLTKVLAPIAAKKEPSPAQKRWKEVFPDEFD